MRSSIEQLSNAGQFTLLCIASLTIMVGSVLAPGVLSIAEALNVSAHPGWLVTLPALGAMVFAPVAGRIIDQTGAYRCLLSGLFLYGLLGMGLVLLTEPVAVYTDRFLMGGITALVMASCTLLISQWYQGKARLAMIAKQGMAIELGGVVFLFAGGLLASINWALPLSIYLLAWVFLAMFILYVPKRNSQPEITSDVIGLALTGHQRYFSLKAVYASTLLAMSVFFSLIVLLPITLGQQGMDEAHIGYLLAFISMMAVVSAYMMPAVVEKLGPLPTLTTAFVLFALAHALFLLFSELTSLILAALFSGMGFGFSIPLLNHMTIQRSNPANMGRCLSFYTMAIFSGQFLTSSLTLLPEFQTQAFVLAMTVALMTTMALLFNQRLIKQRILHNA
jgi:MFS family permease